MTLLVLAIALSQDLSYEMPRNDFNMLVAVEESLIRGVYRPRKEYKN